MANKKAKKAKTTPPAKTAKKRAPSRTGGTQPAASMTSFDDRALREHLVKLLDGGHAHTTIEDALADLPAGLRSTKTQGLPYSAWQLLEHLRIAQSDIVQFSKDRNHVSPKWPEGYWPEGEAPPSDEAWENSVAAVKNDLAAMKTLVSDRGTDLFGRIPHGDGQTILREALLLADHNAYHIGQLVMLRKVLGAWQG